MDVIDLASKLHWKTSFVWGVASFIVLYFLIPALLPEPVAQVELHQPLMDKIANRGQWLFEKLGIAILAIFWFFSLVNFWKERY